MGGFMESSVFTATSVHALILKKKRTQRNDQSSVCTSSFRCARKTVELRRQIGSHSSRILDRTTIRPPNHRTALQALQHETQFLWVFSGFCRGGLRFANNATAIDSRTRSAEQQNKDQVSVCQLVGECE